MIEDKKHLLEEIKRAVALLEKEESETTFDQALFLFDKILAYWKRYQKTIIHEMFKKVF